MAQADAVCASFVPAAKRLPRAAKRRFSKVSRAIKGRHLTEREQTDLLLPQFAWLLGRSNKLNGRQTGAIGAIPPAPGDEATVAAWLDGRRLYKRISEAAVRYMKHRKASGVLILIAAAGALQEADSNVAGFGFERCSLAGDAGASTALRLYAQAGGS